MNELYKLVQRNGHSATAIIGMTKNVGKTVTLNYLINKMEPSGKILGLVSAGFDGERYDRLTLKDKPRIYVPVGAIVATAKECFEAAEAELELLLVSPVTTPLGDVCLGRVNRAGLLELAGPGSGSGLKKLTDQMRMFGAEYILVDGAINRLASASPMVTEATILATGAVLGSTMTDVIRKTIFRCAILNTPCVEEEALLSAAQEGLKRGNAAVVHRDGINYQVDPIRARLPLIAGARLKEKYRMESVALILGGALIDSVLKEAMDFFDELPVVVVKDASKIFISPEIYYRYLGRGGKIRVVRRINLVAVTLNPTNPVGKGFNPQLFLKRMTEALSPLPVFDLVLETN